MTAALIMYHPDMEKEHGGGNVVVEKVNQAATASGVTRQELTDWSNAIKKRFHDDNFPSSPRNQDQPADIEYLAKQIANLQRMYYAEKANNKKLQAEMSQNNAIYESLVQELRERDRLDKIRDQRDTRRDSMLEAILSHHNIPIPGNDAPTSGAKRSRIASPSNSTISTIASPPSLSTSSHSLPTGETIGAAATLVTTAPAGAAAAAAAASIDTDTDTNTSSTGASDIAATAGASAAPKRSFLGHVGSTSSGKKDETSSDAKISLSGALVEMHKRGSIANGQQLSSYGVPGSHSAIVRFVSSANQNKIHNCFKLVEMAWSEEDEKVLCSKYVAAAEQSVQLQLKTAAANVEKACLKKMLELEKSVGIKERKRGKAMVIIICK
eukprot:CAMPEP_0181034862 /NCGR_PEP_ID=MMETSP1070-20121207/8027_1 /TAXON_ID=265543 /ORGANISM="Minutocellus polymorphus, Strain NH13" /LENGTH=381 /DNA_ID=CAMNT_0023112405 /DNA_START=9 /DNA_END=1154 /DNA_ORIENTATION=+